MLAPLRWLALGTMLMAAACLDGSPTCANDGDCPSAWQCLRGTCTLRQPSGETPDAGAPDAGTPDAGTPDAGTPDAGAPDAGTPDAGAPDAGMADAGMPVDIDIEGLQVDGGRAPDAGLLDDGRS